MQFTVVVEQDEDGYYVASVPELPGCHTQAKTLDELIRRIRDTITVYLESEGLEASESVDLGGFGSSSPRIIELLRRQFD